MSTETAPPASAAGETTTPSPSITLHWLDMSRSQRILWLLEELQLPYTLKTYARSAQWLAPQSAKEIHPLGKFPILELNGHVLAESGLIIETLVDRYGEWLMPAKENEEEWLRYRYWMHYAEGSLMPPMLVGIVLNKMKTAEVPFFIKPIINMVVKKAEEAFLKPQYETHFSFLEKELQNRDYLVGDKLTGADIMMSFPLIAAKGRVEYFSKERTPKLWAYSERLAERAAYKKALEKTDALEKKSTLR